MHIPPDPHGLGSRCPAWYYCTFFLIFCFIVLTCSFSFLQSAYAATTDVSGPPTISWDASMIYAGQNNNLPWGPVGERATVHGNGFPISKSKLTLVLVRGDSNANRFLCSQTGVSVASVTANSLGKFTASFLWPAAAGSVEQRYSICAQNAARLAVSTQDSGPFTVLSGFPPVIQLSTSQVAAGNSVTVTGRNWVPPQPVTIVIGRCGNCVGSPSNTFVTSTVISSGLNTGTFSAVLLIPSSFPSNTYTVDAYAHMDTSTQVALLDLVGIMQNNLPPLTVTAAPVITPVASPTVSPTAIPTNTATATSTVVATQTVTNANTGSTLPNANASDANHFPLFLVLGALLPLAVTLLGLVVYVVRQRRKGALLSNRAQPSHVLSQYGVPSQGPYGFQSSPGSYANMPNQFVPEPTWPQNYPNEMQQPTAPLSAASAVTVQDFANEVTVSTVPSYGSTCFKCGMPLGPASQFCGNCGTHNDEFFS